MSKECPRPNHENDRVRAHLGTTTGPRLCPKDQPQQVRMPKVAELSQNAWPHLAAAAGAPHTAAVRFLALLVVVSRCAPTGLEIVDTVRPGGVPYQMQHSSNPYAGRRAGRFQDAHANVPGATFLTALVR